MIFKKPHPQYGVAFLLTQKYLTKHKALTFLQGLSLIKIKN